MFCLRLDMLLIFELLPNFNLNNIKQNSFSIFYSYSMKDLISKFQGTYRMIDNSIFIIVK